MTLASESSLTALRATVAGEVLLPGDPGYDEARSVWNGQIDRRPAVIARCISAQDVANSLAFGWEQQLEISVRGGGHNFAGLAVVDGGLMIDLSRMNGVTVDAAGRRARAGGGATWADLDAATQAHGLAVTGGVISHTGVGGLTLGGGFGWLTRKLGLSCDNVVGAEVVTVDGRILQVSADENADLFWAIRGGGGNFGVVTTIEFQLAAVGPMANLALLFWGMENAAEALRSCREFIRTLPDDVGCLIGGLHAPPEPFVPTEYQLRPGFGLLLASWGSP